MTRVTRLLVFSRCDAVSFAAPSAPSLCVPASSPLVSTHAPPPPPRSRPARFTAAGRSKAQAARPSAFAFPFLFSISKYRKIFSCAK